VCAGALVACIAVFSTHSVEDIKSESIWGSSGLDSLYDDKEDDAPAASAGLFHPLAGLQSAEVQPEAEYKEDSDYSDHESAQPSFADLFPTHKAAPSSLASTSPVSQSLSNGDNVKVEYTLRNADTGEEIAHQGSDDPFSFELGAHHVIPGFEQAVGQMSVGQSKSSIYVSAAQGYGKKGFAAAGVPPNTNLEYDIKVVGKN